jgi:hypothetical protein
VDAIKLSDYLPISSLAKLLYKSPWLLKYTGYQLELGTLAAPKVGNLLDVAGRLVELSRGLIHFDASFHLIPRSTMEI